MRKKSKIAVIGKWGYQYSLELFFSNALKSIGYEVIESTKAGNNVDISLVLKGEYVNPKCLSGLKILYFPDNIMHFQRLFDKINVFYDYIFVGYASEIVDNKRVFYLPFGYDPSLHYPLSGIRKRYDTLFVGTYRPERYFITQIPKIKIFGNDWAQVGINTLPLYGGALCKVHARAKIVINYHYPGDTSNPRIYETLANNAFLLTDRPASFIDGKDLVVYGSFNDLLDKIKYYLAHEDERQTIAESGYKAVQKHTYRDRMKEMMEIVGR